MTKEEAFDEFSDFMRELRCGDNSCVFGRRGGMGTNGGCRTLKDNRDTRMTLRMIARKWREIEARVAE